MRTYENPEVLKLQYLGGKVDYVHGGHTPLSLADVAPLKRAQPRSGLEVCFWDSGSGTESLFFFNQDFEEPKMRALIRNPKFRKALSHAYNRQRAQKLIYFGTGELTTGTYSPKAIEYKINAQGKKTYQSWRDSALKYDPNMAKRMLDEIDVTDTNGDGFREMPGGGKLSVTVDYPADAGPEHVRKNELLVEDWKTVGINARLNPISPEGYDDRWFVGKVQSKTAWEVGNGPDHLTNPTWLVPIENSRWAPLHGQMYSLRGTPEFGQQKNVDPYKRTPPRIAPEPGSPIDRLYKLYDQTKVEPDAMKRHALVWDMVKVHIDDGPFFMGTVANSSRIVLVREGLMNVPTHEELLKYAQGGFVNPWSVPSPAVYDPETYSWEDPSAHGQ